MHYLLLFKTKELVDSNQPIYKFGKTTKSNYEFPEGARFLQKFQCRNCHILEKKIISYFTVNYEPKIEFGRGYFKGDNMSMFCDLARIISNEKHRSLLHSQIRARINVSCE